MTTIKPFEAPQRSVKIKISLDFFTLTGIGTLRVKVVLNVLGFLVLGILHNLVFMLKSLLVHNS